MNCLIINSINHNYQISIHLEDRKSYKLQQNDLPSPLKDDIVNLLSELINKYNLTLNNLDAIGVVSGPGGYTSLRVGLALSNSLGLALSVPVIGISLFEVLIEASYKSFNCSKNGNYTILSVVPDYKGGLFGQFFDNNFRSITEPMVINQDDVNFYKSAFVISNDVEIVKNLLKFDINTIIFSSGIDSESIQSAINKLYNYGGLVNKKPVDVMYIKPPKITIC